MELITWAENGAPPRDIPPGDYKVQIVSANLSDANYSDGDNQLTRITVIRYLGKA